jgi:hypothetical protein
MLNGTTTQVTVTQSQQTQFCNQEFRSYDFFSFPMTPRIQQNGVYWMSESQVRFPIFLAVVGFG